MPRVVLVKNPLRDKVTLAFHLTLDDAEDLFAALAQIVDLRPSLVRASVHRSHVRLRDALRRNEWTNYAEGTPELERAFNIAASTSHRVPPEIARAGTDVQIV
jgi:hypothetical protein